MLSIIVRLESDINPLTVRLCKVRDEFVLNRYISFDAPYVNVEDGLIVQPEPSNIFS